MRHLSSALDGPEVIMDAEEYLQPRSNGTTTSSSASTNGTLRRGAGGSLVGTDTMNGMCSQETSWPESPHSFHIRYRERHRNGMAGSGRTPSAPDSRYCSDPITGDPLKILGRDTSDGFYSAESAKVGNLKLDLPELPVDEDDYLMPSPQTNQNSSTYLDLVSDSGNHGRF